MQKILPLFAALTLGLSAGCSYNPAEFPSQEELYSDPGVPDEDEQYPGFVLKTRDQTVITARVDDGGILAPIAGVNLGRYRDPDDHAIRGVAFGQWMDLKVQADRVTGIIDGLLRLDVTSSRREGGLHVYGLVRGYPADYRLDDQALSGVLGRCSYSLRRAGEHHYQGVRRCSGEDRIVRVKLPPELRRWSDPELGAALGILLGGC